MVIKYNGRGLVFRNYMIYCYKWGMVNDNPPNGVFQFDKSVGASRTNLFEHIKRVR